jgi:hypothetical protein
LNNELNRRPVSTTPFFKDYKSYINERDVIDEVDENQQKLYLAAKQKTDMVSTYKYTPLRQSWDIVGNQQQSFSPTSDIMQLQQQRPKSSTNFKTMSSSTSASVIGPNNRFQTLPRTQDQQTNLKNQSTTHNQANKPNGNITSRPSSAASCLSLAKDAEFIATNGTIYSGFSSKKANINDDLDGDPVKELDSSTSTYASVNNKKTLTSTTTKPPSTSTNTKATLNRSNDVSSKKLSHLLKPFNNISNVSNGTTNDLHNSYTSTSTSNVQKIKKIFS